MRLKQFPQALIVVVALLCAPTDARLNAQEKRPRIQYKISGDGQIGLTAIDVVGNSKQLTFDEEGQTNSTVLKIDGKDVEFGMAEGGRWDVEQAPLGKGKDGKTRRGHKSVWTYEKITITQIVEVVPSRSGELDACVISYVMENKDNQPHKVGIRAMIDTQIGDNDGNPFAIPGKKETITTSADFKGKDVPELVAAFENDDLQNPGLTAHFSLKIGRGHEAPDRFSITTLPEDVEAWDVPVRAIDGDAAVAIYWNPRELRAGTQRIVGYAYGQGVVSLADPAKKNKK